MSPIPSWTKTKQILGVPRPKGPRITMKAIWKSQPNANQIAAYNTAIPHSNKSSISVSWRWTLMAVIILKVVKTTLSATPDQLCQINLVTSKMIGFVSVQAMVPRFRFSWFSSTKAYMKLAHRLFAWFFYFSPIRLLSPELPLVAVAPSLLILLFPWILFQYFSEYTGSS